MCWGFSKETNKIIFELTEQNVGRPPSERKNLTKFKSDRESRHKHVGTGLMARRRNAEIRCSGGQSLRQEPEGPDSNLSFLVAYWLDANRQVIQVF